MHFNLLKNKQKIKENAVLKNKKTQEKSRGRSMVEMLGVLAIIGVLSIGGIQGYTIAMRKHRINEILNVLGKYAMILYNNCQQASFDNSRYEVGEYCPQGNFMGEASDENEGGITITLFENASLGPTPKGLKSVFVSDPHILMLNYIKATDSGDIVLMYAILENEQLCKDILNQVGTDTSLTGENGLCEYKDFSDFGYPAGYWALVNFIMS